MIILAVWGVWYFCGKAAEEYEKGQKFVCALWVLDALATIFMYVVYILWMEGQL